MADNQAVNDAVTIAASRSADTEAEVDDPSTEEIPAEAPRTPVTPSNCRGRKKKCGVESLCSVCG